MTTLMELAAKARLYRVECWEPAIEGDARFKYSRGGLHQHVHIVCHSAVDAIQLVQAKHPTYRVDSVNQLGAVNYIAESSVLTQEAK